MTLLTLIQLFTKTLLAVLYLTITTPGISYALNIVSQFMSEPVQFYFSAVKRIIQISSWYTGTSHPFSSHVQSKSSTSDAQIQEDPLPDGAFILKMH